MRLAQTDAPIEISRDYPLLQVQPIPHELYSNNQLGKFAVVEDLKSFSAEDWDRYRETVVHPNKAPDRRRGAYAVKSRRSEKRGEGAAVPHRKSENEPAGD
jgi:hypothetical protein